MSKLLKLNLGSGQNPIPGYLNVDKYGEPDFKFDLETFPWPWENSSVERIEMNHVLEHLGESTAVYLSIIRELYRISVPNAIINITVPHPRHNSFLNDPTHVRAVTAESFLLFSRKENLKWQQQKAANSTLALHVDVDFEVVSSELVPDDGWAARLVSGQISEQELLAAANKFNNVIKEIKIVLRVIKN